MRKLEGMRPAGHSVYKPGALLKPARLNVSVSLVVTNGFSPTTKTIFWSWNETGSPNLPLMILAIDEYAKKTDKRKTYYMHALLGEKTVVWSFRTFDDLSTFFSILEKEK